MNPFRGSLLPFIFLLSYIFFGLDIGYTHTAPFWTHITYTFQHASFSHLLLNSITFFLFYRILRRYHSGAHILAISFTCAVISSFFIYYDKPVVGASAMIYAMIGIYIHTLTAHTLTVAKSQNPSVTKYRSLLIFLTAITISLFLSFLKPNSAALLHLVCLLSGIITQTLLSILKK